MRLARISSIVALGALAAGAACASTQRVLEEAAGEVVGVRTDANQLRSAMRELWSEHVFYTREYIVAAAAGSPNASSAATRLLKNQEDIGNAIKPYYGDAAGNQLTTLLKDHINIATEVVAAAKAGDKVKLADADRRWHNNANGIAGFLAGANSNWTREALLSMLNDHLSLTTQEAVAQLEKRYADSVWMFDKVYDQSLHMADALTDGIVKQFPGRFI